MQTDPRKFLVDTWKKAKSWLLYVASQKQRGYFSSMGIFLHYNTSSYKKNKTGQGSMQWKGVEVGEQTAPSLNHIYYYLADEANLITQMVLKILLTWPFVHYEHDLHSALCI